MSLPEATNVSFYSFYNCKSLTSVTFGTDIPPTFEESVFRWSGNNKTWNITVPESSRDAYISALTRATNTFTGTKPPTINGRAM